MSEYSTNLMLLLNDYFSAAQNAAFKLITWDMVAVPGKIFRNVLELNHVQSVLPHGTVLPSEEDVTLPISNRVRELAAIAATYAKGHPYAAVR